MTFKERVHRTGHLLGAAAFVFAIVAAVLPSQASAYAGLGTRYIQMSNTANGATATVYKVGLTTVTNNQTIGSVVIDFCSNSPIIGDSCTAPTGFDSVDASLGVYNITGGITGLTVDATNSTANHVVLTRTAAAVANGTHTFELGNGTNGITNPTNTNTTFYAKISTHTGTTGGVDTAGTDAGGVALSTANQLSLTAKVQETLTFCVYTSGTCGGGGTAVILGDANGVLLSTATHYTDTAEFDIASNAQSGVAVKLKGGLLTSGANNITSSGTSCTADSNSTAVEQFGFRLSTVGAGQTADSDYGCSSGNHTFDTALTNTTYGQNVATTAGATDSSTTEIEFTAKAAGTTEAGIYTSTLTMIATATY